MPVEFNDLVKTPRGVRGKSSLRGGPFRRVASAARVAMLNPLSSSLSAPRGFQLTYLLRPRELRNVQCLGGAREIAVFRDGQEVTDSPQQHGEFPRTREQLVLPMVGIINPSWTL
ncbi:hypothetical protein BVI2075_550087 [Burkholderia vietnamiensis]|nr:hypothetical protein BVI2075_550087 [Burkholderia vietnamiensis]